VAQLVPGNATFMISFSQTMRVTSSNRLTVKPADSQIRAEARSNRVGNPAKAPNRIISMPL
jgi:hypothetical protein